MRVLLLLLLSLIATAQAADWPQFLGPQRDGTVTGPAFPEKLSAMTELWSKEVGEGHAGPVVAEEKVVLHHRQAEKEIVTAWHANTGNQLWSHERPATYRDSFGMDNGPRAVPAIADGKVYTHGADGVLQCLSLATGERLWSLDSSAVYESPQGFFGRACSPLIIEGKVIFTPGGKCSVVALDALTGKELWSAKGDEASYASPVLASSGILLCWLRDHLTTLSLADGKILDRVHHRPEIDASVSAATPVRCAGGWFTSAEYDVGASLWTVSEQGSLKKQWHEDALLSAHYTTPVAQGSILYGLHGRQERGMTLRAIDTEKKSMLWESQRLPGGTLLRVQDKLLVLTETGELWLVKANSERFDLLDTSQVLRAGHRSYAAYSDGILYARDSARLVALRLR